MKKSILSLFSLCTAVLFNAHAADVRQGLVSYWPLDAADLSENVTLDVVAGNNMQLYNIKDNSVVTPGKFGNAFKFDATLTQLAYFNADTNQDLGLPATRNAAHSILLWVKGAATGQSDLRYFCESAVITANNNPLYALGTQATGASAGSRIYLRNSTGGVLVDNTPTNAVMDGTWHHVAMVYNNGAFNFYVDGQTAYTGTYVRDVAGIWDTTAIGGIVRAAFGSFFTGSIDDVAVWARALTQDEVRNVMTNSLQTPVPKFAPGFSIQPAGNTNLLNGDSITLAAGVYGSRPMTYQWTKNGQNLPGQTGLQLSLPNMTAADSGDYVLIASNAQGQSTSAVAKLAVGDYPAPNLANGMISYWPLDNVIGTKTPDLVSGYDMTLVNMTAVSNVVDGKWGKAMKFDNATRTLLQHVSNPGEALPIYKNPNFSISIWVNGAANQSDRRFWSEGSTANNNPLFNLGTHNGGADGSVDNYIRTDTGATSGDHKHTVGMAFDGSWHHVGYVQRDVGGVMTAILYIDGVADETVPGPVRPLTLNTTTIGGILRSSASSWFSGLIDEVTVWNRALSPDEVQILQTTSITNPPSRLQPLAINSFRADLPSVVAGGSATLRWDVSKDAAQVKISPVPGDVTASTVVGVGSATVTLTNSGTFVLTVSRGLDTLSATTSVAVVSGVAPGWSILDDFNTYPAGSLNRTGWWLDLRGDSAQVGGSGSGRFLTMLAADSDAILDLRGRTVTESQAVTLFFRMTLPAVPEAATLQHVVGLTDKNPRSYSDLVAATGDAVGGGFGPAVYPAVIADPVSGTNAWFLGARNGLGGAMDFTASPLQPGATYKVWLEITNAPAKPDFQPDTFSVYLQKEGDATREKVFDSYLSDRDPDFVEVIIGGMQPNLDKLVVAGNNATTSASFDDFYLSSGYNATLPVGLVVVDPPLASLSITTAGAQVRVSWNAGTLEQAPSVTGPWTVVAGATSPRDFAPASAQQFFRVRQ